MLKILFCIAQVKRFKPQLVAVRNESLVNELKEALSGLEEKPEIIPGEQGVIEVAEHLISTDNEFYSHPLQEIANRLFFSGCPAPRCSHSCYRYSRLCRAEGNCVVIEVAYT